VALVGVIMGSDSDWPVMEAATQALAEFDVPYEVSVVSRTGRRSACSTTPATPPAAASG